MSPSRALLYDNAHWLTDKLMAAGEGAEPVDAVEVFVLAESIHALLVALRKGEARPPKRRAWERSLERHYLSIARDG